MGPGFQAFEKNQTDCSKTTMRLDSNVKIYWYCMVSSKSAAEMKLWNMKYFDVLIVETDVLALSRSLNVQDSVYSLFRRWSRPSIVQGCGRYRIN